jgi:hypothetical protein
MKQDIIQNLLVAQAMLDELPDAALIPNLGDWGNAELRDNDGEGIKPNEVVDCMCGAVGCFGGWVAATPYFQNRGVEREHGTPFIRQLPVDRPGSDTYWSPAGNVSDALFGVSDMFESRRANEEGLTEREIIQRRIKQALVQAIKKSNP